MPHSSFLQAKKAVLRYTGKRHNAGFNLSLFNSKLHVSVSGSIAMLCNQISNFKKFFLTIIAEMQLADGRRFDRKDLRRKNRKLLYSSNTAQLKLTKKFAGARKLFYNFTKHGVVFMFRTALVAVCFIEQIAINIISFTQKPNCCFFPTASCFFRKTAGSTHFFRAW